MFVCFSNIIFIAHYNMIFIILYHLFHRRDCNIKAEGDLSHCDSTCSISQKSDLNGGWLGVLCLNIIRVIITGGSSFANSVNLGWS